MPCSQPRLPGALLAAAVLLLPVSSAAQAPPPTGATPAEAAPPPWTLSANLSYAETGGNTETGTAGGGLEYTRQAGLWTTSSQLQGQRSSNQGTVFAESYNGNFVVQRKLDERLSAAFLTWATRNQFRALDLQLVTGAGLVWALLDQPDWGFSFTAGTGWEFDDVTATLPGQPGTPIGARNENFPVVALQMANRWQISPSLSANQVAYYYADAGDLSSYNVNTTVALKSALTRALAVQISYQWSYDNDPVTPGIRKTDTALTTSLVLTLKP